MEEWRCNSTILDLGSRRRCVVSFMPRPLYPRYPLDRRLDGPQNWSGRREKEKIFAMPGIEPGPSSLSLYRIPFLQIWRSVSLLLSWARHARGGWRKLHNEELHNSYSSSDMMKVIIMVSWVCSTDCIDKKYIVSLSKPEDERQLWSRNTIRDKELRAILNLSV
jgi:hypothetical protein